MNTRALDPHRLWETACEVCGRGGHLAIRARGHSMHPHIADGERVVLGPLGPAGPRPGEVVLARTQEGARLHRVLRHTRDGYLLRGDAAAATPEQVSGRDICARVVRVERAPLRRLLLRLLKACGLCGQALVCPPAQELARPKRCRRSPQHTSRG